MNIKKIKQIVSFIVSLLQWLLSSSWVPFPKDEPKEKDSPVKS